MKIRAITFDAGGTLIKPWPSVGAVYASVAARHNLGSFPPEQLTHAFREAWGRKSNFNYLKSDWRNLVRDAFRTFCEVPESCFEDLYEEFARGNCWEIYDDVLPTLEALRARHYRLGIISNWDERLRTTLRELELTPYFEIVVISKEVGKHKPSPEPFLEAARELSLQPEQIAHVGDSPEEDWQGATAAGFRAWLLQREGSKLPEAIQSLEDLPQPLASIKSSR